MTRFTLLLPLALAACATAPAPLPPPDAEVRPVTTRDSLEGRWDIAAIDGSPVSGPSLTFDGTTLRSQLACNSGGTRFSRNGDKLFAGPLALTERACDPELMRLDGRVSAILRLPVTMELTPPIRLRLINEAGTIDLVRHQGA